MSCRHPPLTICQRHPHPLRLLRCLCPRLSGCSHCIIISNVWTCCRLQCEGRRKLGPFPVDAAGLPAKAPPQADAVTAALRNGMSFYESLQVHTVPTNLEQRLSLSGTVCACCMPAVPRMC